jgi:hypothetical protein
VRFVKTEQQAGRVRAMPDQRDLDRRNDARFITPLLTMAVILAIGILIHAL